MDTNTYVVGDRVRSLITLNAHPNTSDEPSLRPGHVGTVIGHLTIFGEIETTIMFDGMSLPLGMKNTQIKPYTEGAGRTIADIMYDLTQHMRTVSTAFGVLHANMTAAMQSILPAIELFVSELDTARRIAAETDVCADCGTELDRTEFTPDRNGDPVCGDCWISRKGLPDA